MPFIVHWEAEAHGASAFTEINTPAGPLQLHSRSGVIIECDWMFEALAENVSDNVLKQHVESYWLDTAQAINVRLLEQGTLFRRKVWAALLAIPFGATFTYAHLAMLLESAPRAVGGACRANPFPLLIPCHRVVSGTGLGGYNGHLEGDFIAIKRNLLAFERETCFCAH
jgi:methylated-DNA-[protein]-cysteine S-methyltransferase